MQKYRILWADDEIELLKPHLLFLAEKGYDVTPINNGREAVDMIRESTFDIIFLDENMPGLSGLEALRQIKDDFPNLPVVMITKNEEEDIMEQAIGAMIADYLIKPVNPNQILLSVKRLLDNQRIVSEKTNQSYQQQFMEISNRLHDDLDHDEWADLYRRLISWEMKFDQTDDNSMSEILITQKKEANTKFCQFVQDNYITWLQTSQGPMLSHQVLKQVVFPQVEDGPVVVIVIDNLRYDQWEMIEPQIGKLFEIESKSHYYSILPTATAYARNALFAGMMPLEIEHKLGQFWVGEEEDRPKNNFESELLGANLKKSGLDINYSYNKILKAQEGSQLSQQIDNLLSNQLVAIVYNFVDMLSHSRTDMQMIKELAPDESAYRELTQTWFTHSTLYETLKKLADRNAKVIITTDHGTIRVSNPVKIQGDRNTNTNLRYKTGRNLAFDEREVFFTRQPEKYQLPKSNLTSSFAFATEDQYFVYPNNYNHFANHYLDTFQHGGVSMEEMIVPLITLKAK